MKRGISMAERTVAAPVANVPAAQAPAPAQPPGAPGPGEAGQAAMPCPGPLAYLPRPPAMQDDAPPDRAPEAENTAANSPSSAAQAAAGDNPFGISPLVFTAQRGSMAKLHALLKNPELDVDQLDPSTGLSALMAAAMNGHVEALAALTAAGARLELVDLLQGLNALGHALADTTGRSMPWLLAAGADANAPQTPLRRNAVMLAAWGGTVDNLRTLLARRDVPLDRTDPAGYSALHMAVRSNRPEAVECLLTAGASMTLATPSGQTALSIELWEKRGAVVDVLLQHGAELPAVDFFDVSAYPYSLAVADLCTNLEMPADAQANPLGLVDPRRLDAPLAFIAELNTMLESGQDLLPWLRSLGLRMACALPVFQCIATLPLPWPLLAARGEEAGAQ